MTTTTAAKITASTEPITALRDFARYALENGIQVYIAYGQTDTEGFVLSTDRWTMDIQNAETGALQTVAYTAIYEATEIA